MHRLASGGQRRRMVFECSGPLASCGFNAVNPLSSLRSGQHTEMSEGLSVGWDFRYRVIGPHNAQADDSSLRHEDGKDSDSRQRRRVVSLAEGLTG